MPAILNNSQLVDFAPAWVSDPDGRGTWDLLRSCVFTLFLCVYTAIHLNVGPEGEGTIRWWSHKCKWVGIAIFSPELVLYSAGKQWFSARRLCKKLDKLAGSREPDPAMIGPQPFRSGAVSPKKVLPFQRLKRPKYSMTYGYFVVMGGFVVDVSHLHNSLSRLTITPKGVAFLARHGHLLGIPESTIRDKSKADVLAKVLVCAQVTWMLIQTIGRAINGYPITLLEIHTIVHVACAITMYVLWFQKPLDVRDPAWVDSSGFEDLLALMLVRNYGLGNRAHCDADPAPVPIQSKEQSHSIGSEGSYLQVYSSLLPQGQVEGATVKEAKTMVDRDLSHQPKQNLATGALDIVTHHAANGRTFVFDPPRNMGVASLIRSGQSLSCGIGPAMSVRPIWERRSSPTYDGHLSIPLSEYDIRRWNLAARALARIGEELHPSKESVNYLIICAPNIFIDRRGLQVGFYSYFCGWASGGLIAALVLNIFYGAAHMSAWNFTFPTSIEHLLWKVACIDIIAGVTSLLALFSIVIYLYRHNWKSLRLAIIAIEPGILPWLYRIVIILGLVNVPLYLLSRAFIVVEIFVSLRRVPWGVYATVNWAEYIPHL